MGKLFQDELTYLRDSGREFARMNPKLAPYLSVGGTDPDVERLLEGFAFLTSRIREKIDDEMSEFTISVIKLLWPNFLRAFPSVTMMKLTPIEKSITSRQIHHKGISVLSAPVEGRQCVFRITAKCCIYPLEIDQVKLKRSRDSSKIIVDFSSLSGLPLSGIGMEDLRLTLCGDMPVRQMLYLWLGRYLKSIDVIYADGTRRNVSRDKFIPGGFGADEAILPQQSAAFEGYRLLQEYFVFPDKFYCYDLTNIGIFFNGRKDATFSLEFTFERAIPADIRLKTENIRLYCVPAVNLYQMDAEPITFSQTKTSYPVRPLSTRPEHIEVFSVDKVRSQPSKGEGARSANLKVYPPFESFDHECEDHLMVDQVFFYTRPHISMHHDGFDHDISFVLHNSQIAVPTEETISIGITCFDRSLCSDLAPGDICIRTGEGAAFVSYANLTQPKEPVYPPLDGTLNWDLISNLSLNYMSLLNRDALAAILSIYDYRALSDRQAERVAKQRIKGISGINTVPVDRIFKGLPIRGLKTVMEIKEDAFQTEGEMYLFAAVLAEFFTLYATVNSFHELEVHGLNNGEIYKWPAKIGRQPLI